jgi:hypothetical protein
VLPRLVAALCFQVLDGQRDTAATHLDPDLVRMRREAVVPAGIAPASAANATTSQAGFTLATDYVPVPSPAMPPRRTQMSANAADVLVCAGHS